MNLGELGEFGWIERIAPGCLVRPEAVVRGIGDDCAVIRREDGRVELLTTDLLIEGVHFLRHAITPAALGAKALGVSLSDIAAMGGRPLEALVSIAVPSEVSVEYLDQLYAGLKSMAARFSVNLVGGDTTGSRHDLVINVALTGEADEQQVVYRAGARPGDLLYVTGFLGDSRAGLDALLGGRTEQSPAARELCRRHHEVYPQVVEGQLLARSGLVHAMIDVSDGLGSDLRHLCQKGQVGAIVREADLPLSEPLREYCGKNGLDPFELALAGGEDYVLLLAAEPGLEEKLAGSGVTLHRIGRVLEPGRQELVRRDGSVVPLEPLGWDHFRAG